MAMPTVLLQQLSLDVCSDVRQLTGIVEMVIKRNVVLSFPIQKNDPILLKTGVKAYDTGEKIQTGK